MKSLLHHSIFLPLPNGHGGEKRTYQLFVQCRELGYEWHNLDLSIPEKLTIRRLGLTTMLLLRVYGICHWKSLWAFMRHVKYIALRYDALISFFRDTEEQVFLWESVRPEWYILPFLAHKYHKQVIACPHNTESLVPNQKSSLFCYSREQAFQDEIKMLRTCEQVYAISHEETWLLNLWGVNAKCYLYAPVGEILQQMLSIRLQREQITEKSSFLLLGTAINTPTRSGMQHIIDLWQKYNIQQPLHVGGYGSDTLSVPADMPQIVFLGELSDTQLQVEQLHAKALIIYQPPTTGALTRISEAIAANIPIIANYAAARSYHNLTDISVYQSDDELINVLYE